MSKVMVKLEHFSKNYDNQEIIKDLNLEVFEGEFLTLLGSSGTGKTTILRAIAGIDDITSGHIYIDGMDVTNTTASKRQVNTIFQNYALFPHMNVEQNIGFGLKVKGVNKQEIKQRVTQMLELVQLVGYEKRKPSELSGGQQQRVSIARGLINQPKVLLLDEPLSALDLKLSKQMQLELKTLQKKTGITFIFVTHDQSSALSMSDRIVLLHDGNIEQVGTPHNIYRHPKTKYVADFIGDSNIFDGIVTKKENNFLILKLDNESLIKINGSNYEIGQQISIVFRPEDLKINDSYKEYNSLKAVIKESIYDGNFTRLILSIDDHEDLKINITDDIEYKLNQEVYLSWDKNDIIIIGNDEDEN